MTEAKQHRRSACLSSPVKFNLLLGSEDRADGLLLIRYLRYNGKLSLKNRHVTHCSSPFDADVTVGQKT